MDAPNRLRLFLPAIALICGMMMASGEITVENVRAKQRKGTNLVDITYDLGGTTKPTSVSLKVSSNGGASFNVPATKLKGAVGAAVPPGPKRLITWDAGGDWLGKFSRKMRFRVIAEERPVTVLSWDVSHYTPSIGIIMMGLDQRVVAMEIIEKNSGRIRRNAGMQVIEPESDRAVLMLLGESGLPTLLCVDDHSIVEFLSADRPSKKVRWRLLDGNGNEVLPPRTDLADAGFFAVADSMLKGVAMKKASADGTPAPTMLATVETTFYSSISIGNAAANIASNPSASAMKATLGGIVGATGAIMDTSNVMSGKESKLLNGAVIGFNAVECGTFLAAGVGTLTPGAPAATPIFVAKSITGTKACLDLADEIANISLEYASTTDKAREFLRLGHLALGSTESPLNQSILPGMTFVFSKNTNYFVLQNRALAFFKACDSILKNDSMVILDRIAIEGELNSAVMAFASNVKALIDGLGGTKASIEVMLATDIRNLEVLKSAGGSSAELAKLEEKIEIGRKNTAILNEVDALLRVLLNNAANLL